MANTKKYLTEEERKKVQKEYNRNYYLKNKEKLLPKQKEYNQIHNEDKKIYNKQYYLNNKDAFSIHNKQYYNDNAENIKEKRKQYYTEKRHVIIERNKYYYNTLKGYCGHLLRNYISADKEKERIGDNLLQNYISLELLTKIVQQPCFYGCGEADWHNMGIDRIDNSKPHTIDNIVPCCTKCNRERGTKSFDEFYTMKMGEVS